MLKRLLLAVVVVFAMLLLSGKSRAEIYRYSDDQGVLHYVDDPYRIPEKYQGQLKDAKPLPQISIISPASKPVKYNDGLYNETSTNKKIEIFVTSWCPYCKKLLASLDANGIAYMKYDIEKDSNAHAVYKSLGGGGVPLTRIGSTTVRGNDPEAIMRLGR